MAEEANDTTAPEFSDEEIRLLTELEKKHKRITPFRIEGFGLVVIRPPSRTQYLAFQKQAKDDRFEEYVLAENLARECVAYPDKNPGLMSAISSELPGAIDTLAKAALNLSGAQNQELVRNLGKDWKRPAATT